MITSSEYSSALAMQVKTVRCPLAWALAGTTLLLALPLAGHATPPGKSESLAKGEFAFTGTEQCAYASAFGPPPVLEAKGPVTLLTSVLQGTLSLAADGTGRLTGRIASLMGAIKMEHHGTQHHRLTQTEFRSRYRDNFDSFPE